MHISHHNTFEGAVAFQPCSFEAVLYWVKRHPNVPPPQLSLDHPNVLPPQLSLDLLIS